LLVFIYHRFIEKKQKEREKKEKEKKKKKYFGWELWAFR